MTYFSVGSLPLVIESFTSLAEFCPGESCFKCERFLPWERYGNGDDYLVNGRLIGGHWYCASCTRTMKTYDERGRAKVIQEAILIDAGRRTDALEDL